MNKKGGSKLQSLDSISNLLDTIMQLILALITVGKYFFEKRNFVGFKFYKADFSRIV